MAERQNITAKWDPCEKFDFYHTEFNKQGETNQRQCSSLHVLRNQDGNQTTRLSPVSRSPIGNLSWKHKRLSQLACSMPRAKYSYVTSAIFPSYKKLTT